jgi:glycosyltransferase involved in cell wall biosynthesis
MNIIAPINSLGYGVAGLNICKALHTKTKVSLWPISEPQLTSREDVAVIQQQVNNAALPDWGAPCVRLWHQHDMSQFVGNGQKIGFPVFELDKFKDVEKHHLSYLDKIFVCSEWAKTVMLDEIDISPENVSVIPLGVDNKTFKRVDKQKKDATIFFNCGKWEVRKGHDVIAKCFNKAFTKEDNVELWMMCDNPFCTDKETRQWQNIYMSSELKDKIRLVNRVQTSQEVYNIMSQVDCGIFPARAEGWNLEALELLACGKHLIITDYSAHKEFCTKENSHLVSIDKTEKAYDGKWFDGKHGSWASIGESQIEQIVEHMRAVHKLNTEGSLGVNEQGVETALKFSWDNSAEKILSNV